MSDEQSPITRRAFVTRAAGVNMPVEDDTSPGRTARDFTQTNWAVWNGTSFAAPKIAAMLAAQAKSSESATGLLMSSGLARPAPDPNLGILFPNL